MTREEMIEALIYAKTVVIESERIRKFIFYCVKDTVTLTDAQLEAQMFEYYSDAEIFELQDIFDERKKRESTKKDANNRVKN